MFILEVIVTCVVAVILAILFIILPAAFAWLVFRKIMYSLSGGKIDLFTRQEKIDLGLHTPGKGYYSEDVYIRKGKEVMKNHKELRESLAIHPATLEDYNEDDQVDVAIMMMRRAANNSDCQDEVLAYRKRARRKKKGAS